MPSSKVFGKCRWYNVAVRVVSYRVWSTRPLRTKEEMKEVCSAFNISKEVCTKVSGDFPFIPNSI